VENCGRVGQATDDNIIWCLCFSHCITKATDVHPEYVILHVHGNNGYVHTYMHIAVLVSFASRRLWNN
jgi:hypothetical protein